ncbi:hypothetical protein BKA83DRAFT_18197 [Pisolithus microcarpus]|nr:hypothetical protein BKA83DRAFT_18197 [Pisolithus microcarpus]
MVLSLRKASKQREATIRWLNKPGILEAQREKARLRAARQTRNCERKKAESIAGVHSRSAGPIEHIPDQSHLDDDVDLITSSLHSSAAGLIPTLPELRLSIDEWKSDWGPESVWLKKFDESLCKAWEKGLASTDRFFTECEDHAREGHCLLRLLQQFASTMRSIQQGRQVDTYLQIFNLLEVVLSEVKFFEIKLDEYAPAVPYSQVSDARYYSGM